MKKIIIALIAGFLFFTAGDVWCQNPSYPDIPPPNPSTVTQMPEGDVGNLEHLENIGQHLLEELGELNEYTQAASSAYDLYNADLLMDNSECMPDLSVDAGHMMPTACAGNGECQQCYTGAYRELAFLRRQLGRLSCIYNNTKRFNEAAIAFGDNTSGIHAVTGLSWQSARAGIIETYDHFKQTYDNKYAGMMEGLQKALMDISRCEGQYGQADWYQRFGFIYFEMMKEKYKRTD